VGGESYWKVEGGKTAIPALFTKGLGQTRKGKSPWLVGVGKGGGRGEKTRNHPREKRGLSRGLNLLCRQFQSTGRELCKNATTKQEKCGNKGMD